MKNIRRKLTLVIILMGVTTTVFGQWGFGTNTPDASAMVDVSSTTRGFLPPRMTDVQIAALVSPPEGLMVYNLTQGCVGVYTNSSGWVFATGWVCGLPRAVSYTAGSLAPVTTTITYGTVYTSMGGTGPKCWITQNLGASQQAASATDATEESAGWYWQFNRQQGYTNDGTTLTPSIAWPSVSESSDWTSANDPCTLSLGGGWRLPTKAEWISADATPQNWNSYTDAFNSVLKLHAAGYLMFGDGSLYIGSRGTVGYYWSSTQSTTVYGNKLYISNVLSTATSTNNKSGACSVRCLKD